MKRPAGAIGETYETADLVFSAGQRGSDNAAAADDDDDVLRTFSLVCFPKPSTQPESCDYNIF